MKRILILLLTICSVASFGQILQDPNSTPSTARTNEAISGAYTVSGTDTYTISPLGSFSYTYLTGKAVSITFPPAQINTGSATLNFDGLGAKNIQKYSSGALTDVEAGDLVGTIRLRYDGTQFVMEGGAGSGGGSDYTGNSPTTTTVGGLASGTDISGFSTSDVLEAIVAPYVNPVFNSFSNNQTTPVEVGTTLSGSKTFTWSISANSGTVSTIDLYNVTTSANLLAGTPNDGSQAQTITTVQLNSSGATQAWRGIGNDTGGGPATFNSSNYTVTSWFYRFYGPTSTAPTNSATVRALPSSAFVTGAGSFTLATGSTEINFVVALPPGRSITSVIDTDALGADITSSYVLQSSINVTDAGGTSRAYVIYKCTNAVPYASSHNHVITFN